MINFLFFQDRELSPRFYYKLSEKTSCLGRVKNFFRLFFTFLFTQVTRVQFQNYFSGKLRSLCKCVLFYLFQVGVIVLISIYMICGAAMFHNIEYNSLMDIAEESVKVSIITLIACLTSVQARNSVTRQMWMITLQWNNKGVEWNNFSISQGAWRQEVTPVIIE